MKEDGRLSYLIEGLQLIDHVRTFLGLPDQLALSASGTTVSPKSPFITFAGCHVRQPPSGLLNKRQSAIAEQAWLELCRNAAILASPYFSKRNRIDVVPYAQDLLSAGETLALMLPDLAVNLPPHIGVCEANDTLTGCKTIMTPSAQFVYNRWKPNPPPAMPQELFADKMVTLSRRMAVVLFTPQKTYRHVL